MNQQLSPYPNAPEPPPSYEPAANDSRMQKGSLGFEQEPHDPNSNYRNQSSSAQSRGQSQHAGPAYDAMPVPNGQGFGVSSQVPQTEIPRNFKYPENHETGRGTERKGYEHHEIPQVNFQPQSQFATREMSQKFQNNGSGYPQGMPGAPQGQGQSQNHPMSHQQGQLQSLNYQQPGQNQPITITMNQVNNQPRKVNPALGGNVSGCSTFLHVLFNLSLLICLVLLLLAILAPKSHIYIEETAEFDHSGSLLHLIDERLLGYEKTFIALMGVTLVIALVGFLYSCIACMCKWCCSGDTAIPMIVVCAIGAVMCIAAVVCVVQGKESSAHLGFGVKAAIGAMVLFLINIALSVLIWYCDAQARKSGGDPDSNANAFHAAVATDVCCWLCC